MKSIKWKLALIFVIIWVMAIVADKAFGGELYLDLGVGPSLTSFDYFDRDQQIMHTEGEPFTMIRAGIEHKGFAAEIDHISMPLTETDGGLNFLWVRYRAGFRF